MVLMGECLGMVKPFDPKKLMTEHNKKLKIQTKQRKLAINPKGFKERNDGERTS